MNDEFTPNDIPYDSTPSAYQASQEETRTNRRLVALESQVAQLKAELERKNARAEDIGAPIPYVLRTRRDIR